MSARYLKKVLKEQESDPHIQSDPEEEEEEEGQQLNGKPSINPFDLLNDDYLDLDPQEDESEIVDEPLIMPELKTKVGGVSASNQKSKKKKKKKGKEGSASSSSASTSNVEKPLDVILESLSLDAPGKAAGSTDGGGNLGKPCAPPSTLQVDPKYLNAENELRRIFGSKVVRSFEKHEQSGSSRLVRGGARRGAHIPRKTVLTTPSEHWPRWDGSLKMEFLQVTDGYHHFRYVYSSSYRQGQSAFEAAKATHDLNSMASVLMYHPYHLDSLITVAEYYKFMGEHQMAAEAISKCLYALECAWDSTFTPFHGNCQLKYSHETNKPMFTILFTHMKSMDTRGCHRSALEVCKLLLSLDSDDPMGAMFCIDYFSLRAEEYAWLERFSAEYKSDNSLWLFPNFSYSLAICRFYLEKEESSEGSRMETAKATSTDLMKQALMLHPSVLKKLVEKVPLKEKVWENLLKNAFFQADQVGIPSLDHLINIYVERSHIIWRLPELQKLLRDAAQLVIDTLRQNSSDKNDWACVRKEAFPSDKNEYAHLLASDFSYAVPNAPPENLQHFMGDPRMRDVVPEEHHVGNPMEGGPAPRNVANRNALAVLFESMLPWVHYENGDGVIDE